MNVVLRVPSENRSDYVVESTLLTPGFCAKILATLLGHGAMAAHRTLNPLILVRLQVPRLIYCEY